jgi:hypothetical protein
MATPEQVEEFRVANAELIALVEGRLDEFWAATGSGDGVSGLNALLNFVPLLTQQFGELASTIAMDWFEELRFDAIDAGQIAAIGRATSYEAVRTDPVILTVSAASRDYWQHRLAADGPDVVVARIKDGATRAVRQSGRATIGRNADRDPASRGWQRMTRPGACRFCRALASRGGVYTRQSVRFAAHGPKCNCVAAPTWNPDAPEADPFVYVASRSTAGMSDEQRRIQRERVRGWLEREFPGESDHSEGEHTTDGENAA